MRDIPIRGYVNALSFAPTAPARAAYRWRGKSRLRQNTPTETVKDANHWRAAYARKYEQRAKAALTGPAPVRAPDAYEEMQEICCHLASFVDRYSFPGPVRIVMPTEDAWHRLRKTLLHSRSMDWEKGRELTSGAREFTVGGNITFATPVPPRLRTHDFSAIEARMMANFTGDMGPTRAGKSVAMQHAYDLHRNRMVPIAPPTVKKTDK